MVSLSADNYLSEIGFVSGTENRNDEGMRIGELVSDGPCMVRFPCLGVVSLCWQGAKTEQPRGFREPRTAAGRDWSAPNKMEGFSIRSEGRHPNGEVNR